MRGRLFHHYLDQQAAAAAEPGGNAPSRPLPRPAWRESKVHQEKKAAQRREIVEGCAKEWEEEKCRRRQSLVPCADRRRAAPPQDARTYRQIERTPTPYPPGDPHPRPRGARRGRGGRTSVFRPLAGAGRRRRGYTAFLNLTEPQRNLHGPLAGRVRQGYLADVDLEIAALQDCFGSPPRPCPRRWTRGRPPPRSPCSRDGSCWRDPSRGGCSRTTRRVRSWRRPWGPCGTAR